MTTPFKKIISGLSLILFGAMFYAPMAFAQGVECDQDGDGFVSFPASGTDVILGEDFNPNGNYSPLEWETFFNKFESDSASAGLCNALGFKEGAEPTRCDAVIIDANSNVYDPSEVDSVPGSSVNPGVFDLPDDGIDQDCNGADGELVTGVSGGSAADLEGLANRVVLWLGRLVAFVSIVILLWGGVMYAGASGDGHKTIVAKKAIIGAVIGLIIGLLAPTIVGGIVGLF